MRLISLLLVVFVALILGQMDVDQGPSIKIKFAESNAEELAREMTRDVELLMQRGFEKSLGVASGSVKDLSIQATRSNVPLQFRSLYQNRWRIQSASKVFGGILTVRLDKRKLRKISNVCMKWLPLSMITKWIQACAKWRWIRGQTGAYVLLEAMYCVRPQGEGQKSHFPYPADKWYVRLHMVM
jgi:hypothetical protein